MLNPTEGDKRHWGWGWAGIAPGGSPQVGRSRGSSRLVAQDGFPRMVRPGCLAQGGSPRVARPGWVASSGRLRPTWKHTNKQTDKQTVTCVIAPPNPTRPRVQDAARSPPWLRELFYLREFPRPLFFKILGPLAYPALLNIKSKN